PAWPGIVRGALADRRGRLHRLAGRGDDEAGRGREAAAVPGLGGLLVLLAARGDERAYRAWTNRGWLSRRMAVRGGGAVLGPGGFGRGPYGLLRADPALRGQPDRSPDPDD